jgi:predicted aspartyl protease
MGLVMVTARIGADETSLRDVEFMVDTGAFYTILPPAIFGELGIEVRHRERVVTADNRVLTIELGSAISKLTTGRLQYGGQDERSAPLRS